MNMAYITRVSIGRLHASRFRYASVLLVAALKAFALMIRPANSAAQRRQSNNDKSQKDEAVHLKTDLVEIRAVVTDKKGTKITNLNKSDFEVTENSRPQVISFFS